MGRKYWAEDRVTTEGVRDHEVIRRRSADNAIRWIPYRTPISGLDVNE